MMLLLIGAPASVTAGIGMNNVLKTVYGNITHSTRLEWIA